MEHNLKVYNTLSGKKEPFEPLNPPYVGMYVCGPTVYSDVHLGNCRTFTSFDVISRYLTHLGYKVRYVRNITDVGHLTDDADEGEDKIGKKAKLENLEPMEIVQRYTNDFHHVMHQLNNRPPGIEPTATAHIVEQIQMTRALLEKGYAYEVNGSVYFDVNKYNESYEYGKLSGRVLEELMSGQGNRTLEGQEEKRNNQDFALWKKASREHIMRWESPWGEGFPGWHIECSVMSMKYLGKQFDIHGGGMDLKFPHHECEIAQSVGTFGSEPAKYWLHTNMLTVNGQRMGKSVGNSVLPRELFIGNHRILDQAYSPMTLRFFMLQTHYRSTMDMTNEALKAAQKGYIKLSNGLRLIRGMQYPEDQAGETGNTAAAEDIRKAVQEIYRGMDDDFNTAIALAGLFELLKKINMLNDGKLKMTDLGKADFDLLKNTFITVMIDVLGLKEEPLTDPSLMIDALLNIYREAKQNKNYGQVDALRARFKTMGIVIKDMKDRIDWAYEE